jgi:hypothetical protein
VGIVGPRGSTWDVIRKVVRKPLLVGQVAYVRWLGAIVLLQYRIVAGGFGQSGWWSWVVLGEYPTVFGEYQVVCG